MRESYVWDRERRELVPAGEYYARKYAGVERSAMLIRDIQPYRSIVDGSVVSGRRQHKDHLRAHGCVEVGNEKVGSGASRPVPVADVAADVKRAMQMPAEERRAIVRKLEKSIVPE